MRKSLIIVLSMVFSAAVSLGASTQRIDTLAFHFSFEKGVSSLEGSFDGNAARMDSLSAALSLLNSDPRYLIHSVRVSAAASPEGSRVDNERLARARARRILNFLMDSTMLSPSQIKVSSKGEDWEGLMGCLYSCSESWQGSALEIISRSGVLSVTSSSASARCKLSLKALEGGKAWEWMEKNAFPSLRKAEGNVVLVSLPSSRDSRRDTLVIHHEDVIIHKDTIYNGVLSRPPVVGRPVGFRKDSLFRVPAVAVRSNLLMPLMNVGIEVPLSNRFSLGADLYFPWIFRGWMNAVAPPQMYCFQALAASLEGRWWLGAIHGPLSDARYRLRGHSIGVSLGGGYYDFEYEGRGEQGEIVSIVADWTYALPLGRGGLHLEFTLGVGCAWNPYRNYTVRSEGGFLIGEGEGASRLVMVPRVGVSLIVPLTLKEKKR